MSSSSNALRGDAITGDRVARDGVSRSYRVLHAAPPIVVVQASGDVGWMPLLLVGLVVLMVPLTIVLSRRGRAARRPALDHDDAAWTPLEPSDLPDDPADALAELARRADVADA